MIVDRGAACRGRGRTGLLDRTVGRPEDHAARANAQFSHCTTHGRCRWPVAVVPLVGESSPPVLLHGGKGVRRECRVRFGAFRILVPRRKCMRGVGVCSVGGGRGCGWRKCAGGGGWAVQVSAAVVVKRCVAEGGRELNMRSLSFAGCGESPLRVVGGCDNQVWHSMLTWTGRAGRAAVCGGTGYGEGMVASWGRCFQGVILRVGSKCLGCECRRADRHSVNDASMRLCDCGHVNASLNMNPSQWGEDFAQARCGAQVVVKRSCQAAGKCGSAKFANNIWQCKFVCIPVYHMYRMSRGNGVELHSRTLDVKLNQRAHVSTMML